MVAKVFGVSTNTIRNWVKSFANDDLRGLEYQRGRGRKSKLSDHHLQAILKWTQENPNLTIIAIVERVKDSLGVISSKSAVHRGLKALGLSYVTPRPVHYNQDKSSHPAFLKKSARHTKR